MLHVYHAHFSLTCLDMLVFCFVCFVFWLLARCTSFSSQDRMLFHAHQRSTRSLAIDTRSR